MPPPAKLELPPLGKFFVIGYDNADTAFPIVAVHYDPEQGLGQTVPNIGSAAPPGAVCSGAPNFPGSYSFVGATQVAEYRRWQWVYQILPSDVLIQNKWDDFAQSNIVIAKQLISASATVSPGVSSGVLTETQPFDKARSVLFKSNFGTVSGTSVLPTAQTLPAIVEVEVPTWFTEAPIAVQATSGFEKEQSTEYAGSYKRGKFAGTLTRKFSVGIPSAPIGNYLNFTVSHSRQCTAYGVTSFVGVQYAKVLEFITPENIGTSDPTTGNTYIVAVQTQPHTFGIWVQEVLSVTF